MSKESRLVFLAGLTLCLYAGINFMSNGGIVFPFPLNSFIFLIVTAQFTFWHHKKGFPIYVFLLTAMFGVLANPVLWEIVFSLESLKDFARYPWLHWFYFLNALGLIISAVYLINKQKRHFTSLLTAAGIILFGYGVYSRGEFHVDIGHFDFAGLALIAVSVLIRPTYKPLHFLWILLFVLQLTEWLTFTFAG